MTLDSDSEPSASPSPLPSLSSPPAKLSSWHLLRVWLGLSVQSFGGGSMTLTLIQRANKQYDWVTEEEFARIWALVQVAPGINLLGLTILLGYRAAGARGILLCLFGLLFPSGTITMLLTAGYVHVQRLPMPQAALHGIIPATIGLGLLTTIQIMRPVFLAAKRQGWGSVVLAIGLMVGSGLAVALWHLPVILTLFGAGLLNGLAHSYSVKKHPETADA